MIIIRCNEEETDRENGRIKGSKSGYIMRNGDLLFYIQTDDENKYFHLPLIEIETD